MRTRFALDLEACVAAVSAGVVFAGQKGWLVTIAVVDDSGGLIALSRMNEGSPAGVDGAIGKARSAAAIGIETRLMEAMVAQRPAVATMGRVCVEGGIPILHQGQRVGGVGVSGVQSSEDAEVARLVVQHIDAS